MATTLLGSGRAIGGLDGSDTPLEDNVVDIQAGAGGGLAPAGARLANLDAGDAGGPLGGIVDPRAEQASATNLFNERLMDGIGAVMEGARSGESSGNVLDLDRSLRGALDGHLETALGAVRDNYVVPASLLEGLKRQGKAATREVAGAAGTILAGRRRAQHVAGFDAMNDGLTRTVQQNPTKLPVALARLKAGLDVARDTVLSPEEADRKLADDTRTITIAALTQLAETKPDTVIEAAPKGGLSALGKDDAGAVLSIAKQARAREAARAKEQREVEAATKRAASLIAGKPAKAFDPAKPKDVKLVASVYGQIENALAAELANAGTRREAARKVARFAAKTGVVPPKVAARIDVGLAGGDAVKVIPASLTFAAIAGQAPKLLTCVAGDPQCLRAMRIATAVKAGSSDEEAIRIADTEVAGATPQTIKARLATYREDRKAIEAGNAAFLEGKRAEAAKEKISQPTPDPDQPARFNALVERYYGPTGNLETARATALFAMRRGVVLEGAREGGGKTLDPNAALAGSGSEAVVRGEVEGKDAQSGSPNKTDAQRNQYDLREIERRARQRPKDWKFKGKFPVIVGEDGNNHFDPAGLDRVQGLIKKYVKDLKILTKAERLIEEARSAKGDVSGEKLHLALFRAGVPFWISGAVSEGIGRVQWTRDAAKHFIRQNAGLDRETFVKKARSVGWDGTVVGLFYDLYNLKKEQLPGFLQHVESTFGAKNAFTSFFAESADKLLRIDRAVPDLRERFSHVSDPPLTLFDAEGRRDAWLKASKVYGLAVLGSRAVGRAGRRGQSIGAKAGGKARSKLTPAELRKARQAAVDKSEGKVFQVGKTEKIQFDSEGTVIQIRKGDIFATEVRKTGRPLGFKKIGGVDEFRQFKDRLLGALPPKFSEAKIGLRGSSIHGNKHQDGTKIHDGPFFDTGKKLSDRDLFVVSPKIAREAGRLGILKEGEKFTPLEVRELKLLGLNRLADLMGRTGSRTISIRLYDSQKTLAGDGSYMTFKWGK